MTNIAFKPKLKRLAKQKAAERAVLRQAAVLKLQVKHRSCMNSTCGGFLINMICSVCQTEFCKRCEKILDKTHQCKQEDLDSVNFVNNLIRCPQCVLPVFKNEGCNNISCSNCGCKFLYSTGEEGGSGSHNTKIAVDIEQRYKLSILYKDKIPPSCVKSLVELESLEPKSLSKDIMLLPVKKYIETKNEKMAKLLANKIDTYYQNRLLIRDYQTYMLKLENMLKADDFSQLKFSQRIDHYIEQFH